MKPENQSRPTKIARIELTRRKQFTEKTDAMIAEELKKSVLPSLESTNWGDEAKKFDPSKPVQIENAYDIRFEEPVEYVEPVDEKKGKKAETLGAVPKEPMVEKKPNKPATLQRQADLRRSYAILSRDTDGRWINNFPSMAKDYKASITNEEKKEIKRLFESAIKQAHTKLEDISGDLVKLEQPKGILKWAKQLFTGDPNKIKRDQLLADKQRIQLMLRDAKILSGNVGLESK